MKSELSQFEEKFKLRESILLGCDTIAELSSRIPYLSEMRIYSEALQEKTVEAQPQDICVRWGASEDKLISEYIKTFIRISDAWLSVRNCFGQDGRCAWKNCCLDGKELSTRYVDWMHSSRQLLQSIVQGLEKVNVNWKKTAGVLLPGVDGRWGYPTMPCQCSLAPKPETKAFNPERNRYNQPPPLYPGPPPAFTNVDVSAPGGDYMTPSSYDIPRKKLTEAYRRMNVACVKSQICKDLPIGNAYAMKFVKTGKIPDEDVPQKAASEGSLDWKFHDCKSDSESNFSKKDDKKKKVKKVWAKRRPGDLQTESVEGFIHAGSPFKASGEKPHEPEVRFFFSGSFRLSNFF